jgi:uncharacterized lipoprotein
MPESPRVVTALWIFTLTKPRKDADQKGFRKLSDELVTRTRYAMPLTNDENSSRLCNLLFIGSVQIAASNKPMLQTLDKNLGSSRG